jgi:hypothetical protein
VLGEGIQNILYYIILLTASGWAYHPASGIILDATMYYRNVEHLFMIEYMKISDYSPKTRDTGYVGLEHAVRKYLSYKTEFETCRPKKANMYQKNWKNKDVHLNHCVVSYILSSVISPMHSEVTMGTVIAKVGSERRWIRIFRHLSWTNDDNIAKVYVRGLPVKILVNGREVIFLDIELQEVTKNYGVIGGAVARYKDSNASRRIGFLFVEGKENAEKLIKNPPEVLGAESMKRDAKFKKMKIEVLPLKKKEHIRNNTSSSNNKITITNQMLYSEADEEDTQIQ